MQIEYAKNARWADASNTLINLTIKWEQFSEELPFTASASDVEAHGRAVFASAAAGEYGPVAEYVAPEIDPAVALAAVKWEAKQRLEATDWTQASDVAAILVNKAAFDAYRADVRAIFFAPVADPQWLERPEAVWASQ